MTETNQIPQNIDTVIICISDNYLARAQVLADFYHSKQESTLILTPDFSHSHKTPITDREEGVFYLHHRRYQKNLSWQRIYGHMEFAKLARKTIEEIAPKRIHCLVPANSLARQMDKYKKHHPEVELILDINDLWPESLPIPGFDYTPPALIWRMIRNRHLQRADYLFCECELFADILEKQTGMKPAVLYWSRADADTDINPAYQGPLYKHSRPVLSLCYLGSVNNIIDLEYMKEFLSRLSSEVQIDLHLIANGAKKQEMIEMLNPIVNVIDHGLVYDSTKKQEIFSICHFGLNLMKPTVCIGLSMKSLDYLEAGLPILNSLHGDLHQWIEENHCGINLERDKMDADVSQVIDLLNNIDALQTMRQNARSLFCNRLSLAAFYAHLEDVFSSRR